MEVSLLPTSTQKAAQMTVPKSVGMIYSTWEILKTPQAKVLKI
jgi:hypothetical protein